MQTPAFPLPIHLGFIIIVLPLVWVFVVVAEFLCFGSLFEGGLFVSGSFVWVFCCWFPHTAFYAFSFVEAWKTDLNQNFCYFCQQGFQNGKMTPLYVFEEHRILHESLPYWHFRNHKMFSCCDTLNGLSLLLLFLCFFHYGGYLSFLWSLVAQCSTDYLFAWNGIKSMYYLS